MEKIVILQSIGIIVIKSRKQGQSSTPADILVDNLIPTIQLIGIKLSTRISADVDDCLCFSTFYHTVQ